MKNGYSIYVDNWKFEVVLDGIKTASVILEDVTDPEHGIQIDMPFDDFLDYMKTLSKQFDLTGE